MHADVWKERAARAPVFGMFSSTRGCRLLRMLCMVLMPSAVLQSLPEYHWNAVLERDSSDLLTGLK